MSVLPSQYDLIVLAADKSADLAMRGILSRPEALGIRRVKAEFIIHPEHDPGCVRTSHDYLRPYLRTHAYAIVVLDYQGCGCQDKTRPELEEQIEALLARNGWSSRSAAIVLDPELEMWVWSDSPEVDVQLGWAGRQPDLRTWLRQQRLLPPEAGKPERPKEAMKRALYEVRKPWSSALHHALAKKVSLKRCTDGAFLKLRQTLRAWFPRTGPPDCSSGPSGCPPLR